MGVPAAKGTCGPELGRSSLMEVAPYFGIKPDRAREIVAEADRAVSAWRTRGREIGMSEVELDQFADAFEHAERDAAHRIGGG